MSAAENNIKKDYSFNLGEFAKQVREEVYAQERAYRERKEAEKSAK